MEGQPSAGKLDVDFEKGMGVSIGRLREDTPSMTGSLSVCPTTPSAVLQAGAVLCAELLTKQGYISAQNNIEADIRYHLSIRT